ncbi:MAG TPA: hypothetical protein VGF73_11570, partial [Chthoniobacterales bacterium]
QKQNGISLLSAESHVQAPFLLLMGDHLFESALLRDFVRQANLQVLNLAVDRKIDAIFDLADAMKVQTEGYNVSAIGKSLTHYDAIDTGISLCPCEIFAYLHEARRDGDCALADGVRLMAADGKVRAIDIGAAWWQDVDDGGMLAAAEKDSDRLTKAWPERKKSADRGDSA